jgi:SM-20-related protein
MVAQLESQERAQNGAAMKRENAQVEVIDNQVPQELQLALGEFIRRPIWAYGWRSNQNNDRYSFWHAHFAGGDGTSRRDCETELRQNQDAKPVADLWNFLAQGILQGHVPLRVYANAHTYGVEGYVHTDSTDEENYFTTIFYAHQVWRKNWSGEIMFYSPENGEIISAVSPRPGRLVHFPGALPHKAQAPSRECPELRVSIVIKTRLAG